MAKQSKKTVTGMLAAISILLSCGHGWAQPDGQVACRIVQQGKQVELRSPSFVYHLDTANGLRAQSWENRLAAQTLALGDALELEIDIGLPDRPLQTPSLEVSSVQVKGEGDNGEVVFTLAANVPAISALVTYRWDANQPVLRKFVEITNQSNEGWNRLLNVRLGRYDTGDTQVNDNPAGGTYSVPAPRVFSPAGSVERGFPVYVNAEYFFSLAHPAGVAEGTSGKVSLRQYPGVRLAPAKTFQCMEAVYGVSKAGEARQAFLTHVQSRMRRVIRGHDRPYAIFEPFGARPDGSFDESEDFLLDNIAKLAEGQRQAGCKFDLYSVDFWVDYRGTIKECDPQRFPNGLKKIRQELDKLGTAMGLWIDGSMEEWTIGGNPNPDVQACLNYDLEKPDTLNQVQMGRKAFCRATEPIKSMYIEGFRYHIRENGVRLLKFDNTSCVCVNPKHEHLPGLYSTEAIEDGLIDFYRAMDAELPDVFLMLYWGYKSPWWLLHADTLFDSGIDVEAASPSDFPSPYARDSITQKLDQAQRHASDLPPLGKDSLGVWLSDWSWNSQVGKERWQGGFVMDLCRGSLLAQPWSDTAWLSPPERKQMADFIALLKARPECFGSTRFILGDPLKGEPYGYCGTDGRRAILALNNCTWKDSVLPLDLNSTWGLPDGQGWDLYRWYPDPARLQGEREAFGAHASIALRPFEVVLLEVVPHGQLPSLNRTFESKPIPTGFAEPGCPVEISVTKDDPPTELESTAPWTILEPSEATSAGGATLSKQPDGSILAGGKNPPSDTYTITAHTELTGITAIRLEALTDLSLPCSGPGRASNGNFALNEFSVKAWPRANPAASAAVTLHNPVADFSQTEFGNWTVAASIDGNSDTGWSVHPFEGVPHVAIFHTQQPIGAAGGTTLEFTMKQGSPPEHNPGRLRLSVTAAKPPIAAPKPAGPGSLLVQGQAPASRSGGTLVVAVKMVKNSAPMAVGGPGKFLSAEGQLAGQAMIWQPVLGTATYPSNWQAWRTTIEPSTEPRPWELKIANRFSNDVELKCSSYFLAR